MEEVLFAELEKLEDYRPKELSPEAFATRYAGCYEKDDGHRLSKSALRGIWRTFLAKERLAFLHAHTNLSMEDIARIGIDKFIYTLGWRRKSDIVRWHTNKVRLGVCCHCKDQFILMMLQHNSGLCRNCRPLYNHKALRQFVLQKLNTEERYMNAHRDMLMDFYILFYNDEAFRSLFLAGSESATEMEGWDEAQPEWLERDVHTPISESVVNRLAEEYKESAPAQPEG